MGYTTIIFYNTRELVNRPHMEMVDPECGVQRVSTVASWQYTVAPLPVSTWIIVIYSQTRECILRELEKYEILQARH